MHKYLYTLNQKCLIQGICPMITSNSSYTFDVNFLPYVLGYLITPFYPPKLKSHINDAGGGCHFKVFLSLNKKDFY